MPAFVVVVGVDSDCRFPEGQSLRLDGVTTALGPVSIVYSTRHADEGHESPVPREMLVDVRGEAEVDLREVIDAYANAAAQFLPLIAVAANAWVGDAEPKLAFDATPDSTERQHFTAFVREESGTVPRPGRRVPTGAAVSLLAAIDGNQEAERLRRAVAQYAMALNHWRPGHETMALAHLFIGMEALTEAAVRRELARTGLSKAKLAASLGCEPRTLSAAVRRKVLFQGDHEAASKAKKASDGFEHGFLAFEAVRSLAAETRDQTARYLRRAILDISEVDDGTRAALEAAPHDQPMRSFLARYMWGTLLGSAEDLAEPNQAYPFLRWTSRLKAFRREPDGTYSVSPDETMTTSFNEALGYRQDRYEMWGPHDAGTPPTS